MISKTLHLSTKPQYVEPLEIDLSSSKGNAFVLVLTFKRVALRLNKPPADVEALVKSMLAGNYGHILSTMETELPDAFKFIDDPRRLK